MPSRRYADAQQLTLLITAVVAAAAACCGFDRGWAYGHDDNFQIGGVKNGFGPSMDLSISLGWWNATTVMKSTSPFVPGSSIEISSDSGKAFGAFTVALLGLSALFALNLLAASLLDSTWYPSALVMDVFTERVVLIGAGSLVLLISLSLYGGLAYGADHELRKQFSRGLFCWPGWAFGFALAAAAAWGLLARAAVIAADLAASSDEYTSF